jgi:hypothetical protein
VIENKIMYTKKKVERKIHIPPGWCSQICAQSMNEVCVEICAPRRDACWFEPKKDYTLNELPPFSFETWQNDMTAKERQTYIGLYMAKVVDRLQGREKNVWTRSDRAAVDRRRDGRTAQTIKVENLRDGQEKGNPTFSAGEKHTISGNGSDQVAEKP